MTYAQLAQIMHIVRKQRYITQPRRDVSAW